MEFMPTSMPDWQHFLSRREFLKVGALAFTSLGMKRLKILDRPLPDDDLIAPFKRGRVTRAGIYVYREPRFKSERLGSMLRDTLFPIEEEIQSPYGPQHNPRWYRLREGYVHSAYVQRVDHTQLNKPLAVIPGGGQLGEISVPYTRAYRKTHSQGWLPLYRLYYSSIHWISSLAEGPNGEAWYGLLDELLHVVYYVPVTHVRPVSAEELSPISPEIAVEEKKIFVNLADQAMRAFEGDRQVYEAPISTGIPSVGPSPNGIPTDTPDGHFRIQVKVPSKHMGDGNLTDDIEAYELLGVPWVCFFHVDGIAFHGTYWHDNFGQKMSHGCINLRNPDAKWLYRWSSPEAGHRDWNIKGLGTRIIIE
jgi:hypothetical protein